MAARSHSSNEFVEIILGDKEVLPLWKQQAVAVEYLEAHREELRALAHFPGVDVLILGFQYIWRVAEGIVGICVGPSARLMQIALDIGIEINFYVHLDHGETP